MFSPLAGPLEQFCGPIVCMLISTIISEICLFLLYIQRNIWFFYSISILVGLGVGISANIPIKNACFYYPEKKGLISASIMSFVAVGTAIYILVGEQLINPEKRGVIDQETDPYYPEDISERVKNYFIFGMFVLPIGSILSCLFFYKYNPICETEEKENEKNGEPDEENEENEGNEETENEKKEELKEDFIKKNVRQKKLNSFYKPSPGKNVKKVLKSFRFWRNIIITSFLPFYFSFINSSFRAYAVMIGVDQGILYYLGSVIALISCFFSPVWATLVDKYGFGPIIRIIGCICSGMSIYFYFFVDDKLFYIIGVIFTFSVLVGLMASMTPHLMTIFGMRYFLVVGGFARLFNEISVFSAGLTSIIISIYFKNAKELKIPYQIIIAIGGGLSIIGLIAVFFENDEKFIYGDEIEQAKYFKKEDDNNPNDNTFEQEKDYINENASRILGDSIGTEATNKNEENVNKNMLE
jgi:MFS family permease